MFNKFFENRVIYEIMWGEKNLVELNRSQMIIQQDERFCVLDN
jgi:hypothetical protein